MSTIALITGNTVVNLINGSLDFANTLGYDQVIDASNVKGVNIGWVVSGGVLSAPPPPNQSGIPPPVLPRYDFFKLFTQTERIALRNKNDAVINDWIDLFHMTEYVDLGGTDAITFVNYCDQQKLLAVGRAATILAGG
jgi:hypothetical protein